MSLKKNAGNVLGAFILGLMIAGCATNAARDVQVRESESPVPANVSPKEQLEQQRQLEERQRDQHQQDRRQLDLERAQHGTDLPSMHASSITKVPIAVDDIARRPEGIVAQGDKPTRPDAPPGSSVNGELLRIEGEYFVIRDVNGKEVRLQVTNETKMENAVQVGDRIQAQVSAGNHAERVRSVDKPGSDRHTP